MDVRRTHGWIDRHRGMPARIAGALALAFLAGCGGGSGDGPADDVVDDGSSTSPPAGLSADGDDRDALAVSVPDGVTESDTTTPWLATVQALRFGDEPTSEGGYLDVDLLRYDEPLTFRSHADFYAGLDVDACEVRELGGGEGGGGPEGTEVPRVSGGEVLLIGSSAGSFAEVRRVQDDPILYSVDPLPAPLPADATLSIPGDEFPAVEAFPLPTPEPFVRLSPAADETLSGDTAYRWEAGRRQDLVRLEFLLYDDNDEFVGFPVGCRALDDGEFELPDEAIRALESVSGRVELRYSRAVRSVSFQDGVTLFLFNEVTDIESP